MHATTTWQEFDIPPRLSFSGSVSTDVVIVGGGLSGTTIAYLLAKKGKRVIVLDKESPHMSVTAFTTAFLTRSLDSDLATLEHMHGKKVKEILRSHEMAIDTVERIVKEENIDCDFTRLPHYSLAFSKKGLATFKDDLARYHEQGFGAEMVSSTTFSFKNNGALLIPHQASFHPLKYLCGLREAAERRGVQFFDHSEVIEMKGAHEVKAILRSGTVTASSLILATYNPFTQPLSFRFKKGMYTSYVLEASIPKGALPHGLYEDDGNPYTYFRVEPSGERMRIIIGGEDHRQEFTFDPARAYHLLERYLTETLRVQDYRIVHRWHGPILEQVDGLALIGRYDTKHPNRYVATAFSGNGMTWATIAGLLLSDMVTGTSNEWEKIYNPKRPMSLSAILLKGRDYMGEFIGGVGKILFSSKRTR